MTDINFKTALLNVLRKTFLQNSFMENRLRHITKGKAPTHWLCRIVPNHYQYTRPSIREWKEDHRRLELDLSDWMEWHLYFDFCDPSVERLLSLCKSGDSVLDVGANIGATMAKLAKKAGTSGRVIGFEPDPVLFRKCQHHLLVNGFTQCEVYPLALGASVGRTRLRVRDPLNLGMNQIVPENLGEAVIGTEVVLATLDKFVADHNLRKVSLLKIDVEGYESHVLKGAERLLSQLRPRIFVEIDDDNLAEHGSSPEEIYDFLLALDYQLIFPPGAHVSDSGRSRHFDLVAIPKKLGTKA